MKNIVLVSHGQKWSLNDSKIKKIALKCIVDRKFDFEAELSIIFVGTKRARDLNMKFRKMDYIPQVLGFPNSRKADKDGLVRLGDIVICTKKLKREVELKENRGKDIYRILESWIEHGVDNLLK